jgi:hypothetical protein
MASQSSTSSPPLSPEESRTISRWRLLIVGLAFVMPVAAVAAAWAIEAAEAIHGRPETWQDLALLPVVAVVFNGPFLILAATVRRNVVRFRPDVRSVRLALAGGLAGLLVPYLLLWSAITQEFVLNAAYPTAGAGASLVGPPVAWVTGLLLAYVGTKLGPRVFSSRRAGPPRPH